MRVLHVVALAALTAAAPAATKAAEPEPADRAAIEACARDYIDGWYEGDAARMERALHPDLAKRTLRSLPEGGGAVLSGVSASAMVTYTRAGIGAKQKRPDQHNEVFILDVAADIASVKTVTPDFIDYIHMARVDGRWRIVNVLWEPPAGAPGE